MLLVLAGLPAPEVNFILRHPDGSWWMRFDMCYPSLKLIIEYDGRQHAEDSNQWLHDLRRREALDRMGWRVIVITKHDYYETPEAWSAYAAVSSLSGFVTSSEPERFDGRAAKRPKSAATGRSFSRLCCETILREPASTEDLTAAARSDPRGTGQSRRK
jgi:hypothetical protein